MSGGTEEIGEAYLEGPGEKRYFLESEREYCSIEALGAFLEGVRKTRMTGKLRLHMEGFRRRLKRDPSPEDLEEGPEGLWEVEHRSLPLGTLEIREGELFLGNSGVGWEEVEEWLRACLTGFWELTPERAGELAELIVSHKKEAEERALRTLRSVLGEELTERFLREGRMLVKAADGREYLLTKRGEVLSPDGRERFCVRVEGGEKLPVYDLLLAKYLAIRDRPQSISTLRRRGSWRELARVRMLVHELELLLFRLQHGRGEFEEDELLT